MKISSTKDMRSFLINQMEKVACGEQEHASAKAIANYAQQIYNTVNMELKVASAKAKFGTDVQVSSVSFE